MMIICNSKWTALLIEFEVEKKKKSPSFFWFFGEELPEMSSYALQLHFPNFSFQSRRKSLPLSFKAHPHFRILCVPPHSDGPDTGTPRFNYFTKIFTSISPYLIYQKLCLICYRNDFESEIQVILVEKYGNGTSKRYSWQSFF